MAAMSKKIFAQIYLVCQLCPFLFWGPYSRLPCLGDFLFELLCCAVGDNSEVIYDPECSNMTS